MNIPNIISIARLMAVPIAAWLIFDDRLQAAFWVFAAAGISDAIDGFIAKRFDQVTELGGYLDPLADKALLVTTYICLGLEGHLAGWLVVLVVFRDALIVGGALLFQTVTQSLSMEPLFISKVNTLAQIILAGLALASVGFNMDTGLFFNMMVGVVTVTTFFSGMIYVVKWTNMAAAMEDDE
ncbi:MAG: CDP-alcohol phosphatidyltransferase family protein [Rhodospirillaceae bacterium]|jgi:cardiolipin synthase (CMP-forming)|nr:CDP-alcohol phosphatidyltransferase family protein [Rhodospirillaceae bacterium]MBT4220517.1 CDP-alcohol phosphatidyltransferase family protein [Rhodospirillaceae bacterium]MBT4463735.1 CDP-alcohol phosphatidyltransferase family protein [Rhodospirillaceae bacterium]MBT5014742.1 CDP-alcohol phosphatidyltransferase family protein [Rhodospirillaceae bacterium]MBT5309428.1 CDP-alcohol phosphatidyltransferase family protein [Rhodospirillaceae bacterium]